MQIEQAADLQALEAAAAQITRLLAALHRGGTRIALMAQLCAAAQCAVVRARLADDRPARPVANSCLFVMGSEAGASSS